MSEKKLLLLIMTLCIVGFSLGVFTLVRTLSYVSPEKLVYQVCNEARISPTIDERGCGDLQDQLGFEFLCATQGTQPNVKCWVENKK